MITALSCLFMVVAVLFVLVGLAAMFWAVHRMNVGVAQAEAHAANAGVFAGACKLAERNQAAEVAPLINVERGEVAPTRPIHQITSPGEEFEALHPSRRPLLHHHR